MMSVPTEYVPYLVGAAVAVAIIFPAVILFRDWKEARAKKKAEKQNQDFYLPQSASDDNVWPPAPKS